MLETMACGTPVIVTDRCGIADFVDGKVGYVVEYDKDHLQNSIFKVLSVSDKELRRKLGEEGKKVVGDEFGWNKIVRKVEQLYESLMEVRHL